MIGLDVSYDPLSSFIGVYMKSIEVLADVVKGFKFL